MYLTGEFADAGAVALAIDALKTRSFTGDDLDVFSSEPVEFAPGVLDRPSRMSFFAVAGAVAVGSTATGFIWFTQHHYRLVTGGMPIFSFWGTGVITYEMTMLGAIATTFLWLLQESGLLERGARGPAPVVEPGSIYLRILCPDSQVAEIGELLYRSGATRVEKLK